MIKRTTLLIFLALSTLAYGQVPQIEMSGVTSQGVGTAPDTFRVHLQSLTGSPINVRSATLSILHNSSCATYTGTSYSLFMNLWNQFFESVQVNTLTTPSTLGGTSYNQRLMYANVSATTPPVFVSAPVAPATVEVLSFTFSGACTDKLYLEDNSQFFPNAIGDPANNPIPFRVKRTSSLPVEFLNMEAKAISTQETEINWTTSREVNSAFFQVEKSFDADFTNTEVIGEVQAAVYSDTETNYSFNDKSDMAPVVYYRLRQFDLNGDEFLSNTMSVKFNLEGSIGVVAYPNPFTDILTVNVEKAGMTKYTLRVVDLSGKVHYSAINNESNTLNDSWKLNLGHLPRGCYMVHVAEAGGKGRQRVFKVSK
ncbi:MAG: T9SS type A sorting domain-containing protein [Bacteroidia bacterium]